MTKLLPALALLCLGIVDAQVVKIVPYYPVAIGTANIVTLSGTTSIDYIAMGSMNRGDLPYNASGLSLSVPIPSGAPAIANVYFSTWTCATYSTNVCLSATLDNYTAAIGGIGIVAGAVNTFTPATPLVGLKWDFVGIRLEFASQSAGVPLLSYTLYPANNTAGGNTTTAEATYYQLSQSKPTSLTFSSMTLVPSSGFVPLGFYSTPPVIMSTGDSWHDGSVGWCSAQSVFVRQQSSPNCPPTGYLASYYTGFSGLTYMDGGYSGQTSTQILARFATDVIALHPSVVVDEGYINDISGCGSSGCSGGQIATIESNLVAEWSALQSAGIRSLFLLAGPDNSFSNAQMTSADTVSSYAIATAPLYGVLVVDERSAIGVFRAGGTAGNYWNWNTTYEQMDGLTIHPNIAGNKVIAALEYAVLGYLSSASNSSSSNSSGGPF